MSRRGATGEPALLVIAKEPVAGRAKTRLAPVVGDDGAAEVAAAALADTLQAVKATDAARHLLALDGEPGEWLPEGFEVIPQRGTGLAGRLAAAFDDLGGPGLLVGMDTPQITPRELADGLAVLADPELDAVLGTAEDGGWWAVGLKRPNPVVFAGVPMSEPTTGAAQLASLHKLGLRCGELPVMRDIDTFEDAVAVAALAPSTRLAAVVASLVKKLEEKAA